MDSVTLVCTVMEIDRHFTMLTVPWPYAEEEHDPGRYPPGVIIANPTMRLLWPSKSLPADLAIGDRLQFEITKCPPPFKPPGETP